MSARTPRNTSGNTTGNTGTARNTNGRAGNATNTGNAGNARNNTTNTANTRTGSNAATAGAGAANTPLPQFMAEIEVYIKLKPSVEAALREKKRSNFSSLPLHWQQGTVKASQRRWVNEAVTKTIAGVLGEDYGWRCDPDISLRDDWLQIGSDAEARKWWGIELTTPLMSVLEQWQREINAVWDVLGKTFDFWTDNLCGFHVHIKPGPTRQSRYTLDQIVKTAKGTYFWEHALSRLVPQSRSWNEYALPNGTAFGGPEDMSVSNQGWTPLFSKIDRLAAVSESKLVDAIKGGETSRGWTAKLSTNFCPLYEKGTIEFRRQAGVASAMSTIRGILLAVTLHISALLYDFDRTSTRRDRRDSDELLKELAGCIKKLPETCHGTRFINIREEAFRKGAEPPNQVTYDRFAEACPPEALVLPAYVQPASTASTGTNTAPQTRQGTAPTAQGRGGGVAGVSGRGGVSSVRGGGPSSGRGGGAVSGRGGAATTSTPSRTTSARVLLRSPTSPRTSGGGGGGMTTMRLPERPAAVSSTSSRPVASSGNNNTTSNNTTTPAAGQRRRQQQG
ncbi:uncharacterized protein C8A04DRAFT_39651 [Dichotomopilus funicola]|uniref:Amidoligase enzyme n=1 Tax=Dichotomopilus funicola TaxID=1934379 RepID=A0AAN6ZK27_9PEZI|nr:hypothetical protein C8A04DRAFT_39651 [Dichotomopilus funicola]